ncbi:MAG TPA: hypothetical protein VF954_03675 [Acidimicrobiales bacterium]
MNCGCPLDWEASLRSRCTNCRAAVARAGRASTSDGQILPVLQAVPGGSEPGDPRRALVGVASVSRLADRAPDLLPDGRGGWQRDQEEASLLSIVLHELAE